MPHARPTLAWFAAGLLAWLAPAPAANAQAFAVEIAPARPVAGTVAGQVGVTTTAASKGPLTLEACWEELEKTDPEAIRALLWMARRPQESVAFLKDRLEPVAIDEEQARYLIRRLGAKDEKAWKKAFDELEYRDPRLALDLVTMFNEVTDDDARRRLAALIITRDPQTFEGKQVSLQRFNNGLANQTNFLLQFQDGNGMNSWVAEGDVSKINPTGLLKKRWVRAVRSILLLESIGTPEAVALVKDMAGGDARAQPTRIARDAVERLTAAK